MGSTAVPGAAPALRGHRVLRLGIGPFAGVVPALLVAVAWLVAAVGWGVMGTLPGGRWMVVHLFTLGVVSNLLVAFTQHFARAVTRAHASIGQSYLVVLNAGVVGVIVGMLTGSTPILAAGATAFLAVVVASRVRLARMRRAAPAVRFAWLVRTYERAHEALALGALLGAALGAGIVPGTWYVSVRAAHLHLQVLGWTGLVVLATVLFFAPAMLRVRIPDGVEARAARSLRVGVVGLALGVVLMALPPTSGPGGAAIRLGAAAGLALYAWPVVSIGRSVVRMAIGAHPCAARVLLPAALGWFGVVIVGDVVITVLDAPRLLTALGIAVGVGVALQLIVAVGLYLIPSLRGRGFAARDALIARTERWDHTRGVVLNTAVALLVVTTAFPQLQSAVGTTVAWSAIISVIAHVLLLAALPVRPDPTVARSTVAKRYRDAHGGG